MQTETLPKMAENAHPSRQAGNLEEKAARAYFPSSEKNKVGEAGGDPSSAAIFTFKQRSSIRGA